MSAFANRCLCVFLVFTASLASIARAGDPQKPGPYKVGVRTEVFVDEGRICSITGKPRTLVTEIWYPAADGSDNVPVNKFSDFWVRPEGKAMGAVAIGMFGGKFDDLEQKFQNTAHRNAEIHDGHFPLLIFSHGNGGMRHQNTFQAEYLASHGYVVAAPDHTGNAAVTILPDQVLIYNKKTRDEERRDDRPQDVSFLITQLLKLAGDKQHWLNGRLDGEKVGAFGHSFGGYTVCRVTELDPRVKAIIPMTFAATKIHVEKDAKGKPIEPKENDPIILEGDACKVPVMVILAEADRTVKERGNKASTMYYEQAVGPKYLLNFKGAGHFTFTEMRQTNPNFGDGIGVDKDKQGKVKFKFSDALEAQRITNEYSVAFFDAYLRNDAAAKKFVGDNHYANVVIYQKAPGAH